MRITPLILSLATIAATAAAQTPEQTVAAFHTAVTGGDSAAAIQLLDPKVVIYESGGAEMSRDEFASGHLKADMQYAMATTRTIVDSHSEIVGDLAVVISRSTVTGTYREREVNSRGTETMVLRRGSNGWRIVHIHWSSRRAG